MSVKITIDDVEIKRETEGAFLIEFRASELKKRIMCWMPKKLVKIEFGTMEIDDAVYLQKVDEYIDRQERSQSPVLVMNPYKEYDKSFGVKVQVFEKISGQEIGSMMFVPKSVVNVMPEGLVLPRWLLEKKIKEVKGNCAKGSFKAENMDVRISSKDI